MKRKKKYTQIMWAVGWKYSGNKTYPTIQSEGAWWIGVSKSAAEYMSIDKKQKIKKVRVTIEVIK